MITKTEFNAVTREIHNNNPEFINLTKNNFTFAI